MIPTEYRYRARDIKVYEERRVPYAELFVGVIGIGLITMLSPSHTDASSTRNKSSVSNYRFELFQNIQDPIINACSSIEQIAQAYCFTTKI